MKKVTWFCPLQPGSPWWQQFHKLDPSLWTGILSRCVIFPVGVFFYSDMECPVIYSEVIITQRVPSSLGSCPHLVSRAFLASLSQKEHLAAPTYCVVVVGGSEPLRFYVLLGILFLLVPGSLRYNWHITLCLRNCNMMWYRYILWMVPKSVQFLSRQFLAECVPWGSAQLLRPRNGFAFLFHVDFHVFIDFYHNSFQKPSFAKIKVVEWNAMRSELPWLSSLVGVYLTAVGWRCASSNLKHVVGPGVRCGTQGAVWRSLWWSHKVTAPPGCADIQSKSSRLVFLSGSLSIFGGTFPLYVSFAPISILL